MAGDQTTAFRQNLVYHVTAILLMQAYNDIYFLFYATSSQPLDKEKTGQGKGVGFISHLVPICRGKIFLACEILSYRVLDAQL